MTRWLRSTVLGTGLVAAPGAAALGSWLLARPTLRALGAHTGSDGSLRTLPFELALALMAVAALALCVAWLTLVVTATAFEAATGRSSRLVRAMTPGLVRRLVLATVTVALGGGAVAPATAAPTDGDPVGTTAVGASTPLGTTGSLVGLPLPDRTTGTPPRPPGPPTITVTRGDSLWSLAEGLLPAGTGAAQVDEAWRALYHHNRAAVGPDPHRLAVGAVLRVPSSLLPSSHEDPGPHPSTRKDAP